MTTDGTRQCSQVDGLNLQAKLVNVEMYCTLMIGQISKFIFLYNGLNEI